MKPLSPGRRLAVRTATAAFAAVVAAGGMAVAAGTAYASVNGTAQAQGRPAPVKNPYSPAYRHAYRHGVVPNKSQSAKMRHWAQTHPQAASARELNYGGGIDGIGVTTGHEKVYLVFYGSQWGTQGTDSNGNVTLSGDPSGEAPYLQELMKGLGTGNELWSGVMTQYCEGVAAGSQSCPASSTSHVAYPTGGALAGVWVDESTSSPSAASGHQLGTEAVNAAAHFGNTTAAANRDAQYVIISPHGTNPDGWRTNGFCAWHDYNGDSTLSGGPVSSPYGDVAFTNLPYITDAGASCGQDFVNGNGTLDGVSIVAGHEYAETITDQNPAGGWIDSAGNENGDKCAWITPGTSGGSFDLTTATGTFAMQTTWANDGSGGAGACEASHPIVSNGGGSGNTVTVTSPGNQTGTVGTAVSLQTHASDSASGQTLTYSAAGLPAGLSINSSSGLISGTPTTAGTYNVTVNAADTTGASGSASFTWTISSSSGGGGSNVIVNGGFETGTLSGWTRGGAATGVTATNPHSGQYAALLGLTATATYGNSSIAQTFTAPSGSSRVSFWYNVHCPDQVYYDWATATLRDNTAGTTRTILPRTCNTNNTWVQVTATITAGHSYTLTLTNRDDNYPGDPTSTKYDDVSIS